MLEKLKKNCNEYLKSNDFTLTNEEFKLLKNEEYDMLITDPIPNNLNKYYDSDDYISHTNSNKNLIDKLYQIVRNITLKKKLNLINSFNNIDKNILDIGCGTGDFLNICNKNNWKTVGVEPNNKAKIIAKSKGIEIKKDIKDIKNQTFDVITLWHVLEHVTNVYEYIEYIKEILKENGTLIIAVPNYKSYDAEYYKKYWAAYDVPRHVLHFSKNSIKKVFNDFDMTVEKIIPMKFDSFYVSMLSEKYKNGKINYFKAFYIGLLSNIKAKRKKEYSSHIYILKNKIN